MGALEGHARCAPWTCSRRLSLIVWCVAAFLVDKVKVPASIVRLQPMCAPRAPSGVLKVTEERHTSHEGTVRELIEKLRLRGGWESTHEQDPAAGGLTGIRDADDVFVNRRNTSKKRPVLALFLFFS